MVLSASRSVYDHFMNQTGSRQIRCHITVRGRVASYWSRWLEGLQLSHRVSEDGDDVTDLTGTLADQSALQGILHRIWNLNLTVLSLSTSPVQGKCVSDRTVMSG
jgi:hypothetical protein